MGQRLLILPAWLQVPAEHAQRQALLIDPGSAFGTGSHPTTRLCLEALEQRSPAGARVADLGCGSGILGIASLALGASQVLASDTDSLAVRATAENAADVNALTLKSFGLTQGQRRGHQVLPVQ